MRGHPRSAGLLRGVWPAPPHRQHAPCSLVSLAMCAGAAPREKANSRCWAASGCDAGHSQAHARSSLGTFTPSPATSPGLPVLVKPDRCPLSGSLGTWAMPSLMSRFGPGASLRQLLVNATATQIAALLPSEVCHLRGNVTVTTGAIATPMTSRIMTRGTWTPESS